MKIPPKQLAAIFRAAADRIAGGDDCFSCNAVPAAAFVACGYNNAAAEAVERAYALFFGSGKHGKYGKWLQISDLHEATIEMAGDRDYVNLALARKEFRQFLLHMAASAAEVGALTVDLP